MGAFMHVSIGEAAMILGVSVSTLREWDRNGKFKPTFRTSGGHRRYSFLMLKVLIGETPLQDDRLVVGYARVSSHDQKDDLERQIARLDTHCANSYPQHHIISDLGSGLNYKKRGLNKLLRLLLSGRVSEIILTHKDRLLRFGSELIFRICECCNTKVIVLDEPVEMSDEEKLTKDVLEILTVFSARLYGKRSHKNRTKKVENGDHSKADASHCC